MPDTLFPAATEQARARFDQLETLRMFNTWPWADTVLGRVRDWPVGLRNAVRLLMSSKIPMAIFAGPDAILIYNDAYRPIAGDNHPRTFGISAFEGWPEVADFNHDVVDAVMGRGETLTFEDQELILNRYGGPETVWLSLNYSPILEEDGNASGVVCILTEGTQRMLAVEALRRSEERLSLALSGSPLVGTWDWDVVGNVVTADDRFANLFNLDPLRAGLGMPVEELLTAIYPDDFEKVRSAIMQAISTGEPFRVEYRVIGETGEVRWIIASGRPRRDEAGNTIRFPGIIVDVTEQRRATQALVASELRFRTLADAMPQMVWSTLPDGFHDYYNARWYEFTGMPEGSTDGEGWNGVFHPDDQQRAWKEWRHSLETGDLYEIEYRLRHHSGDYRWTLGRALPIRDPSGTIVRWIGTCTDIHESRQAAEERELVAQELSHRIKNIFAVLTGIISLSVRSNPEVKPFADQLRQRIYALGEAHDFVRPHSHLSDAPPGQGQLSALIDRLMRPYNQAEAPRVRFEGTDAAVDDAAATPIALLFHELATNAAKYGALSTPDGRVTITGTADGETYRFVWSETGGPQVTEPAALSGFGTRLVQLSVEGQMRGTLNRQWQPEGLVVEVALPSDALSRSSRLRRAKGSE